MARAAPSAPSLPAVVGLSVIVETKSEKERALRELRRLARYIQVPEVWQVHREGACFVELVVPEVAGDMVHLQPTAKLFQIFLPNLPWREHATDVYRISLETGVALDGLERPWPQRAMPYNEDAAYADFLAAAAVLQQSLAMAHQAKAIQN